MKNADILLNVEWEGKINKIYVLVRPGVEEFLRQVCKSFEVCIFTASMSNYADPLIDKLDERLGYGFFKLFREHCTYRDGYVKDLSRVGRDLRDVIIIDNVPSSYDF